MNYHFQNKIYRFGCDSEIVSGKIDVLGGGSRPAGILDIIEGMTPRGVE